MKQPACFPLARYIVALLLLVLPAISPAVEQKGILWKISPANGEASYLFGTIHIEDPRVTRLPDTVQTHFNQAPTFCAEAKMDMATQVKVMQSMVSLTGQRLENQVDKQLYNKTMTLLPRYGIPEALAPYLKPWAAAALLSYPVPKTGRILDYVLYKRAERQGKNLCGLENPASVTAFFEKLSPEEQETLLRTAVEAHQHMERKLNEMLQYYLARDLQGLHEYAEKEINTADARISALFQDDLLNQRNRNMLRSMQPYLQQGEAFIAVGVLHLPGDTGLLNQLREQGYRVSPVY